VESVQLNQSGQEVTVNEFNVTEGSIYFEMPKEVRETVYVSVKGSNKVTLLIGNGL
jgi:hypothetical protein